ncbi:macro domain-containing protein [Microbaculum sp. FT89]|uniref:macro domain-containing protein n=1 Tax=Microbaculum sp. FT89 TaxID=3447298 RepID=UPI003F535793
MSYRVSSFRTWSFWRYALFSKHSLRSFFSAIGALYLLIEILDFFGVVSKAVYPKWSPILIVVAAVVYVIFSRRPVLAISYKVPRKDFCFEVKIGDIFGANAETVISSNTTFDTDLQGGLIAENSLQGQMTERFFSGNIDELDRQIEASLKDRPYSEIERGKGKTKKYSIGEVARVRVADKNFYLCAMAHMSEAGNAETNVRLVDTALEKLWNYMAESGELGDIAIPIMGTGRGRLNIPRKKMVERIAQSFADASRDRVFSNKLIIYVSPSDAESFGVNLFEIRDYLSQSLHV